MRPAWLSTGRPASFGADVFEYGGDWTGKTADMVGASASRVTVSGTTAVVIPAGGVGSGIAELMMEALGSENVWNPGRSWMGQMTRSPQGLIEQQPTKPPAAHS